MSSGERSVAGGGLFAPRLATSHQALATWQARGNMFTELGRRLRMLFRGPQFDADLQEEMRLHRELRAQEEVEHGLPPTEAHYAAQRRLATTWWFERRVVTCGDGTGWKRCFTTFGTACANFDAIQASRPQPY